MKAITFTFLDKIFTLDLINGVLHGEDGKEKEMIIDKVKIFTAAGYAGHGFLPWQVVDITDPWHDIYQFTACLYSAEYGIYPHPFPEELLPYAPEAVERIPEITDIEAELLKHPEEEREEIREILEAFKDCPIMY